MSRDTYYWSRDRNDEFAGNEYYESDYNQLFQSQPLDFNSHNEYGDVIPSNNISTEMYDPTSYTKTVNFSEEELPLLEELEIYPDRIVQKMLAILNPFKGHGLTDDAEYLNRDPDLAGPIFFYLLLAVCLFLSGNKAHFGYIYIISVGSCILMYCLLTLMTSTNITFNLTIVASVLGYSLIPIVALSVFGIFISLKGLLGICLSSIAVMWSSISASRLFVAISGDKEQQPLIAYPCALVSGVYVLLVMF